MHTADTDAVQKNCTAFPRRSNECAGESSSSHEPVCGNQQTPRCVGGEMRLALSHRSGVEQLRIDALCGQPRMCTLKGDKTVGFERDIKGSSALVLHRGS